MKIENAQSGSKGEGRYIHKRNVIITWLKIEKYIEGEIQRSMNESKQVQKVLSCLSDVLKMNSVSSSSI